MSTYTVLRLHYMPYIVIMSIIPADDFVLNEPSNMGNSTGIAKLLSPDFDVLHRVSILEYFKTSLCIMLIYLYLCNLVCAYLQLKKLLFH